MQNFRAFSFHPTHSNRASLLRSVSSPARQATFRNRPVWFISAYSTLPPLPPRNPPRAANQNPGLNNRQAQTPAPSSKVIFDVSAADFKQLVLESPVPVILDCWAEWCG